MRMRDKALAPMNMRNATDDQRPPFKYQPFDPQGSISSQRLFRFSFFLLQQFSPFRGGRRDELTDDDIKVYSAVVEKPGVYLSRISRYEHSNSSWWSCLAFSLLRVRVVMSLAFWQVYFISIPVLVSLVSVSSRGSKNASGSGSGTAVESKGSGEETAKRRRVSSAKQAAESCTASDENISALPCLVTLSPGVRISTVAAEGRHTLALSGSTTSALHAPGRLMD